MEGKKIVLITACLIHVVAVTLKQSTTHAMKAYRLYTSHNSDSQSKLDK